MADERDFIIKAREQFAQDETDEKSLRANLVLNLKFQAGGEGQWDADQLAERKKRGLPSYTFNRTHTFIRPVSNEARQNKPQIKYVPAEDDDKDTADVYEGISRHIHYSSDAQEAFETAAEYQVGASFGYFIVTTAFVDDESDDQEIKIVKVPDPLAVYGVLQPACFGYEPDHAFVTQRYTKSEYEAEYGTTEVAKNWNWAVRDGGGWVSENEIRVATYYWTEFERVKRGKRTIVKRKVKCCKINGIEKIEGSETEWVTNEIPVIPVLGSSLIIEGTPYLFSVIDHQRDPQRMINLFKSRKAAVLGLAPMGPYRAAEGQLEGHEAEWREVNNNPAVLQYKPTTVDGKVLPAPSRDVAEPPIAALTAGEQAEIDDMKATTGIYDASLGARGNETSGKAILSRQQQSDLQNYHFGDNRERAYKKAGTIIAKAIPKVYDTPRMVRILGADEAPRIVKINQQTEDGKHYKIGGEGVAKYDVVVTVGKAFNTKKAETFETMTQLFQANPQAFLPIAPLMLRNSDMAGADEAAEIMKAVVNAQFPMLAQLEQEKQTGIKIPPQVQQAMQQMQQQHQALNEYAKKLEGHITELQQEKMARKDQADAQFAIASLQEEGKQALEKMRIEAQIAIAEINSKTQNASERMKLEYDLNAKLAVQNDAQAHDLGITAMQHAHDANMKAADQQHQAAMATQQQQADAESAQEDAGEPSEVGE